MSLRTAPLWIYLGEQSGNYWGVKQIHTLDVDGLQHVSKKIRQSKKTPKQNQNNKLEKDGACALT